MLYQWSAKAWCTALGACSIALGQSAASAGKVPSPVTSNQWFDVGVCLKLNGVSVPFELARAEDTASRILMTAGVSLEWHSYSSTNCRNLQTARTVVLDFTRDPRSRVHPGALAYAMPFEGVHAVVMFDRVADNAQKPAYIGILLGHVMAHEIIHLLQGVEFHSDRGLMKARWTTRDISQMMYHALPLTPDDIDLIQYGLVRRPSATNQPSIVAKRRNPVARPPWEKLSVPSNKVRH